MGEKEKKIKWVLPLVFCFRNHIEDSSTHIQVLVVQLMILPQTEMIIENMAVRFFATSADAERCPFVSTLDHATQTI